MWTPEIVRIRFIEAADTERYLPAERMGRGSGYWPQHLYDAEDRAGWDDQAKADNAERAKGRAPDGAVSRWEECYFQWTPKYIPDHSRRKLVWAFARCRANKWDFGKMCDRKGWIKSTSYDRLNKVWDRISERLCNDSILLREPAQIWIGHETANQASNCVNIAGHSSFIPKVPRAVIYERSRDLLRSEADAEAFADHLAKHNSKVRREQERRESRLLRQIEAA